MAKQIRLKAAADKRFEGKFDYLISYDYASGRKDRYTVMILNSGDPVIIGRELLLSSVRKLITYYEVTHADKNYYGDREDVLKCIGGTNYGC